MTELTLRNLGPFEPGLPPSERGARAVRLTKACAVTWDARPVAQALGRISDAEWREEAVRRFEAMGALSRRRVIAEYLKLSRGRG